MAPEALATNLYIGRIVATARQRKGWTQTDLAEAAGLGRSLVMDIETGRVGLNTDRRALIVRALGLKPSALDAPGFVLLSAQEQQLIDDARRAGKKRTRTRLLGGRLAARDTEAASC